MVLKFNMNYVQLIIVLSGTVLGVFLVYFTISPKRRSKFYDIPIEPAPKYQVIITDRIIQLSYSEFECERQMYQNHCMDAYVIIDRASNTQTLINPNNMRKLVQTPSMMEQKFRKTMFK